MQHRIDMIVLGYPTQASLVQKAIDRFLQDLRMVISSECHITYINEDYSSVEANALTWIYKKTAEEDTLAATILLQRWFAWQ